MTATLRNASNRRDVPADMAERLVVALDVENPEDARAIVSRLDGVVSFYKIGLWLLFARGTDTLIDDLIRDGKRVFLDYKMYDIGATVREGVKRAKDRGVSFITVHGDDEIMLSAVQGRGDSPLKIFAITVLTSMNDADLKGMGYGLSLKDLVALRVRRSLECGCDGIIASAEDQPDEIRKLVDHQGLLIATPGIRPEGHATDDHKRRATPKEAIARGADYLVVGRPIVRSPDPASVARNIIDDMRSGGSDAEVRS